MYNGHTIHHRAVKVRGGRVHISVCRSGRDNSRTSYPCSLARRSTAYVPSSRVIFLTNDLMMDSTRTLKEVTVIT